MCFSLACDLDIAFGTIYVIVQDWIDLTTEGLEKETVFASLINLLFSSHTIFFMRHSLQGYDGVVSKVVINPLTDN